MSPILAVPPLIFFRKNMVNKERLSFEEIEEFLVEWLVDLMEKEEKEKV